MTQNDSGVNGAITTAPFATSFSTMSPPEMMRFDMLWGGILAVLSVTGTIGNIFSLLYFVRKRKKTIHDILYKIMCVFDTMTSLISWPVTVVLFASRKSILFENDAFCGVWTVLFKATTVMALFLVMVISVSRTVSIMAPFHKIMESVILGAIALYAAFELGFVSVLYGVGVVQFVYYKDMGYCSIVPKSFKQNPTRKEVWDRVFIPMANIQTFGPMIIVFVSFIMSVVALVTRKTNGKKGRKEKKVRMASVTIAIFTAIYLFCQLPLLVTKMMSHSIKWFDDTTDFFAYNTFIGWNYSILFQVIFPVLNSTLNPFLYYCRMPKYKGWMQESGKTGYTTMRNNPALNAVLGAVRLSKTSRMREHSVCNTTLYDYTTLPGIIKDTPMQG